MRKHHNKSLYNRNYIRELSLMFTTWSLNFNDGMPLVKRINDHPFSANVLNNHFSFFNTFSYGYILNVDVLVSTFTFIVVCHKDMSWIVAIYTQWPKYRIHNSKPKNETLKPYTMRSSLKIEYELSFHSRSSSQGLLNAPLRYSSTDQYKNVSRCWFTRINTANKVWIWVANNL